MPDAYILLEEHFQKLAHLEHALTFLQWDHMVMMPPGGSEPRSRAIAELTTLHHELLTSAKTGDLLQEAAEQTADTQPATEFTGDETGIPTGHLSTA